MKEKKDSREQKRCTYSTWENTCYIFRGTAQWCKSLLVFMGLSAIASAAIPFIGLFLGKLIIERVEQGAGTDSLLSLLVVVAIIEAAALCINNVAQNQAWFKMIYVRMRFIMLRMAKSMNMNYENLERPEMLDWMRKAEDATGNNINGVEGVLRHSSTAMIAGVKIIAASAILWIVHPVLIVCMMLLAGLRFLFQDQVAKWDKREIHDPMSNEYRQIYYLDHVTKDFEFAKDIRIFSMQKMLSKKQKETHDYVHQRICISKNHWLYCWLKSRAVDFLQEGIMYAWLIYGVLHQGMSIADFTLYVGSVRTFSSAVSEFLNYIAEIRTCCRQVDDFRNFIEYPDGDLLPKQVADKFQMKQEFFQPSKQKTTQLAAAIEVEGRENPIKGTEKEETVRIPEPSEGYEFSFEGVSFRYPGSNTDALKNLNLTLKAGQRLAVVGLNGAGKTTFIKLLLRLYQPTQGRILLNGIDIQRFDREEYYRLFSPVFQDVECFAFPISENVSMRSPEDTNCDKADEVLRLSGLGEKLDSLSKGVRTELLKILYDDGIDLSGGEKQKMSLGRALYKNAQVVVLDEPTSALDALAEYQMYQNFDRLIGGRTAVYISHRLSSTRFCNAVAMFANGEMIEYGTHDELLQKNGAYAEMFQVQAQYYQEENGVA